VNPADLARNANTRRGLRRTMPERQDPAMETAVDDTTHLPLNDRNKNMHLMHEAMARAQMEDALRRAESQRRAHHIVVARRMRARAEHASLRARRALAIAVMQ